MHTTIVTIFVAGCQKVVTVLLVDLLFCRKFLAKLCSAWFLAKPFIRISEICSLSFLNERTANCSNEQSTIPSHLSQQIPVAIYGSRIMQQVPLKRNMHTCKLLCLRHLFLPYSFKLRACLCYAQMLYCCEHVSGLWFSALNLTP